MRTSRYDADGGGYTDHVDRRPTPAPAPAPTTTSSQGWQKQASGEWVWMGPGPEPPQDQWPPEVTAQRGAATAPAPTPTPGPGVTTPTPAPKPIGMRLPAPTPTTVGTPPTGSPYEGQPAISRTPPPPDTGAGDAPAPAPTPTPAPAGLTPGTGKEKGLLDLLKEWADGSGTEADLFAQRTYQALASGQLTPEEITSNETFTKLAAGMNPQQQALYDQTKAYSTTSGEDESLLRKKYRELIENGGYDEATKRALTGIALETAAEPYKVARERAARLGAATNNALVSAVAEAGTGRDAARSMTDASRKNIIDIFNEKERQKELGLKGTENVSGIANSRQQFGINSMAGQNAQVAAQQANAAQGLTANTAARAGRMAAGAAGMHGIEQNIFGRKTTGAQGLMTLAALAAQQQAAQQAGEGGILGRKREDNTEGASTTIGPG